MPNARIAELISARLRSGLVHPGDPDKGLPSRQVALPFGNQVGMSTEMSDLLDKTTELLGEAIVHLIESDGASEIVDRGEAVTMRRAVGDAPPPGLVAVHCRCDKGKSDPLVILTAPGPDDRIVIDGGALIRGLSAREPACPHRKVD